MVNKGFRSRVDHLPRLVHSEVDHLLCLVHSGVDHLPQSYTNHNSYDPKFSEDDFFWKSQKLP